MLPPQGMHEAGARLTLSLPDIAGLAGSVIVAVAYIGNLQGKLRADGAVYSLLNLIGAALILTSLWFAWNLAAALIEIFWGLASLYVLSRAWRRSSVSRM